MSVRPDGGFAPDESTALARDGEDRLAPLRQRFRLPPGAGGRPRAYFCGNSLGLLPRDAEQRIAEELDTWARLAVDGHFAGPRPWYTYHETLREPLARIVGALPSEVVAMNGLTANLHLMMVSFYRPTPERHRVLMEANAFPSDTYAVQSQIRYHGYDPDRALLVAEPREGESALRTEDLAALIERRGQEIALVLLGGVNYYSGQVFDMPTLARVARDRGCAVGYDLAHAAGNVPLALHDWDVDFAVWCSYKYLNAGPGAVAGCFVHERHACRPELPRFAGWWGNDPHTRFRMHLEREFVPVRGADGWQVSNPPVLAMAPLLASLALFDEAGGMAALRAKSQALGRAALAWIEHAAGGRIEVLTPRDADSRGCQLSLRIRERARELLEHFKRDDVVVDFRPPDVLRAAPVPLYNSFHDVWRFGQSLLRWSAERSG